MSAKIRKLVIWAIFNIAFGFIVWFGVVEGQEGFSNLTQFLICLVGLVSLSGFCSEIPKVIAESGGLVSPASVDLTYDLLIISVLAYHAWWWMAIIYSFHVFMTLGIRGRVETLMKDKEHKKDV